MKKQWISIAFAFLAFGSGCTILNSCTSSGAVTANPYEGCAAFNYYCADPGEGQWATAFGQNPGIVGTSFAMQGGNGTHYVYTKAVGLAVGKTMTLNYTISGSGTLTSVPNDTDPPTISLFIWKKGDNLSCGLASNNQPPSTAGPLQYYRQFLVARPALVIGSPQTVSAQITATNWGACFGENAGQTAGFAQAVSNAAYMGFTLGGRSFAGHGVFLKSGSLTFTINSFMIQ
jgi:hypothetical protein